MTEKRYTVEMAIYKTREGSSNIGVNYIRDNYSKNNKMVKCCGRNYVDVEVPESAIVFGDTNRHIINKVCERLNDLNNENEQLKKEIDKLKHRHSLLHDVCIEAECDRDSYHKDVLSLEKENEQLKKENQKFKRIISKLELERCQFLNDKQAKSKWGENYD